ncbi:MAG: RimK family alpha-L-glutamate ligase [candidate division Zixibacteria bacterium]|nr:RimK family alpha-L-glutamate ligase [candidate division Zixibacteria bacterium]
MGKLAIFVDRSTIARYDELEALLRFREAAEARGHDAHFLFRSEAHKIPRYDALFIRALTDPMNATYVAARVAEMHGKPVIDDSHSIAVCCDKVFMYRCLMRRSIPIPRSVFLDAAEVTAQRAEGLFAELGPELVLKAPNTSFSSHVEKVSGFEDFQRIGRRFLHRADRLVVQEFIHSTFDWRVGVLAGEPLYACQYLIPNDTFKIQATVNGHLTMAQVEAVPLRDTPPAVIHTAVAAANAIGQGLYGVDLKQTNGHVIVIEVNDNPTINVDEEDRFAPDVYERIVCYLLERDPVSVPEPRRIDDAVLIPAGSL